MTDASPPFCHLHFHTGYSLLDSACRIPDAMERARELGQEYLAMTDHGVLYGAVEFYREALKAGIKPIIGCEVYVARCGMENFTSQSDNMHLVLLAEDNEGYRNLSRLVSLAWFKGFHYKPRIDKELLAKHSRGLIGLSACLKGEVTESCAAGQRDKACALAREYREILGEGNFFLEIQDHGMEEQKAANRVLAEVSEETGIPLVATNDVHYLRREDSDAHDVLICLQTNAALSDSNRMRYEGDQFYMKSGAEMAALFPGHEDALARTVEIARRCNVEFEFDLPAERLHFPKAEIPEGYNQESYLVKLGEDGLRERYGIESLESPRDEREEEIRDRFFHEVGVIKKTGFLNYFLVVQDFVQHARRQGVPVGPGRGSGAGSLVAYALGITAVDPLRYGLIFERFLNPDRISPPDFDIDFCQYRRGEVIDYVRDKYGDERVAQIITFGTLGAKTLIRDVGRVLEMPLSECDRLAKMVPEGPKVTLEKALKGSPDFRRAVEKEDSAARIMKYARVLEGLPRHPGTHAAGVVIGDRPLIDLVPLSMDKEKQVITQFEKDPLEDLGLLKMDFLGLKTLSVIRECLDCVRENRGTEIDAEKLPLDDPETYGLLGRGDTIGVFQVESAGMRDTLRKFGPDRIEDLIAILALYRPGPMQFIDDFIQRKHGQVPVRYDHELLEPILRETHGIIVYQEQIQQAAKTLAGFSLGQGDILRRAMGKKKAEEMARQRDRFIKGCRETHGIGEKLAARIFDHIEKFASYGFNKSHSTAYGIVACQTAYLKAHYPPEFMAALMSSEMGNTDKLPGIIEEARRMGIPVLPPSVNESGVRFRAVGDRIRFGMAAVKNVGEGIVRAVVREREERGPFEGLIDFCTRMDPHALNRKSLECLIRCGAFDFSPLDRSRLFAGIDMALHRAAELRRDRESGQTSMFSMMEGEKESEAGDDGLPEAEPWSEHAMLAEEKELIGFYISGHPLTQYEWLLDRYALHRVGELGNGVEGGTPTRVGGMVTGLRKVFTKKDQRPMAQFRLEGLDGAVDAVMFPDAFEHCGALLAEDAALMVGGIVGTNRQEELQLEVREAYPLPEVPRWFAEHVSLHLADGAVTEDRLGHLREVAARHPGRTPLQLCLQHSAGAHVFIEAGERYRVQPDEPLCRDFEHLLGEDAVYVATRSEALLRKSSREKTWGRNGGR
ncbi:DNA polymerase III subunit alpha [Kiritimatiella glycovorans]|uniref:DNA polymerase III subunit alpha n=1 Tax=Kiritimatiella glycovorans TaxID=1307763 RepID=A0A0G3EFQ3_9BACT|nr:DNA polymerase III subunit alpha [Kiritimatiella glycovorans]AKJ63630.1 DNA polymerase III subunit alpha [Kiritimatiella glycovorans]